MVKERYTVPDLLRGIAVLCMVAYHTLWDLVFLYDVSIPWFRSDGAEVWQLSIRWAFLLLSGFCWRLGRHSLKRGLLVLGCSAVVSLVTMVFLPDSLILFGVLTCIGCGMLLLIPLDRYLRKLPPWLGLALCLALFLLTQEIPVGRLGPWPLPDRLYANHLTALLGFPPGRFYSTDYVPLIPWLFVFIMGYCIHSLMEQLGWLKHLSAIRCRPLQWLGRHALPIYMLHQPVIYGILTMIFA